MITLAFFFLLILGALGMHAPLPPMQASLANKKPKKTNSAPPSAMFHNPTAVFYCS